MSDHTRSQGLLSQTLGPIFSGPDLLNIIGKWKEQLKSSEVAAGESLPDSVEVAVLLNAIQEPLRMQLHRRAGPKPTLEDLLAAIEHYTRLSSPWQSGMASSARVLRRKGAL